MKSEKYDISGMSCASCQAHVSKAVSKIDGVTFCNVNLLTNSMEVKYDETKVNENMIIKAVKNAGYGAKKRGDKEEKKKEIGNYNIKGELIKLISCFIFLLILMYFSMGYTMFNFPLPSFLSGGENATSLAIIEFLLTIPIIFIYRKYFINGFTLLFKLKPNMDSLIGLGSFASILYSIVTTFKISYYVGLQNYSEALSLSKMHLYFESAAMILVLVSFGKFLEMISKKRTTDSIQKLIDLTPKKATLLKDNKEFEIDAKDIKVGDILIVKKGEIIPVDGKIIEGYGNIDESNLTGESYPKKKINGDLVYSASILMNGFIKIEAQKVGEDSSLSKIIKLVEEASSSKAKISRVVDKISLYFVPTIMIIAFLTFIGFIIAGYGFNLGVYIDGIFEKYDFEIAFDFSISTLVIACPCALGLATPVAIMVASGKGAQNGILIKNAEILENASKIKAVVLDKTGTITEGKLNLEEFKSYKYEENDLKSIVLSIEKHSEHPLAKTLVDNLRNYNEISVKNFKSIDGIGVFGNINNKEYIIGNFKLLDNIENKDQYRKDYDENILKGRTTLFIKENDEIIGLIGIKDSIKETSKEAIKLLKERGIKVYMLTGDSLKVAKIIGNEVGLNEEEIKADLLPQNKGEIIKEIKSTLKKNELVAMVGDGVNDALGLTLADIGIAIQSGSEIAISSSDIVLLSNSLLDIINAIRLSKRTLITIKINLFWALFYNFIGVIIATGVLYPSFLIHLKPMYGALAMSFSSVFVVLTALTINFFKPIKSKTSKRTNVLSNKVFDSFEIRIEGMMCENCVKHVKDAISSIEGVNEIIVSLKEKKAIVKGENINLKKIEEAIKNAGYKIKK